MRSTYRSRSQNYPVQPTSVIRDPSAQSLWLLLMPHISSYMLMLEHVGKSTMQVCCVFAQSAFGKALEDGTVILPEAAEELPSVFVADKAFSLKPQLMRPYPGNNLSEEKAIFNFCVSRAWRVVENAFGIMVTKWRILRQPIITKPETVDYIVKAIGVLHNFMRNKEGVDISNSDNNTDTNNVRVKLGAYMYSSAAEAVRGSICWYFSSPHSSLSYQTNVVRRRQLY